VALVGTLCVVAVSTARAEEHRHAAMKPLAWVKRGLVIAPENAPAWRRQHCGMTSVMPLPGGRFRVFLTGKDDQGRFQIGWLDLDERFRIVAEHADNPALQAGRMGCFDCQGLCMPSVTRVSDARLHMYYVGWGLTAPGFFVNRCGLAISDDGGATWRRHSEAPLPLLDDQDPIGIGTVCVRRERSDAWQMWYTTFREWKRMPDGRWEHYYHIKYADSKDGVVWTKPPDNVAIDFVGEEYAVARPWVVREEHGYRMWFSTRSHGSTYRIGYAESPDGRRWTRKPSGIEPSPAGWDSEMIEYACVVRRGDEYVMFYNGNGFGASGTGIAVAAAD
jgi:hypothetical protein